MSLSALLFIIGLESLACKIRQNKDVKGIKLPLHNYPKNEAKISLYADDITIFVNDEREVKQTVNILNSFYEFSGLKLNTTKTEAMWVGSYRKSKQTIGDLKWKLYPNNVIKSLGIYFSSSKPAGEINDNWLPKINKIKNIIKVWQQRYLTMIGKIVIVKSLLSSQLSFVGSIIDIPEKVIKELDTLLFKYVWGGSEKVKRKTIIGEYSDGGLKMIHLQSFLNSLKATWIKRLTNASIATWKNIPLHEFNLNELKLDILKCNCSYITT